MKQEGVQHVYVLRLIAAVAAALALLGVGAPNAAAAMDNCPHRFGSQQRLSDPAGAVAQEWTLTGLRASTDPVPGYPLAGRLWEATVTVTASAGTVTPIIPSLQAMSTSGDRYPVLWQLASPAGIPGSTISQGQTSTGKVYFDVTGADPAGVMYLSGGPRPLMMWCDDAAMMAMMNMMKSKPMDDCP
ncbi:MPT63 family protein [Mycolicibacterium llatzerense]|uniref:MPT63 family protein n=1 Tax=Mycolicibacterium llatzerense TaxID=280871 RepID=UPI0021B5438F|nr:MPT63 family protein [Mycolicibacterium llatzerense]MCT7373302.1 immunogenic protein MPT63 [Mycolicibacterium llatzerense]